MGNFTHELKLTLTVGNFFLQDPQKPQYVVTGVHNAKAEEYKTPYMCQIIKIYISMGACTGGLHGNKFAKNSSARISWG